MIDLDTTLPRRRGAAPRIAASLLALLLQTVSVAAGAAALDLLWLPAAAPGGTVTVVLSVGDAAALGVSELEALDLDVSFDPATLEFLPGSERAGNAFAEQLDRTFPLFNEVSPGRLRGVLATSSGPVPVGTGSGLLVLEFRVAAGVAAAGALSVDSLHVRIDESVAAIDVPGPGVVDGDGDGIGDVEESLAGLDPTDGGDAALDPDLDGVSTRDEVLAGSDPGDGGSVPAPPYRAANLAGAWALFTFSDDASQANAPWAEVCDVGITGDGAAAGDCEDLDGVGAPLATGAPVFTVSDSGELSITGAGVDAGVLADGHMDLGRTAIARLEAVTAAGVVGEQALSLLVRRGSAYAQGDLAGRWHLFQLGDRAVPGADDSFWVREDLQFDLSGALLPGSVRYVDDAPGDAVALPSGAAVVAPDGGVAAGGAWAASATVLGEQMDAGRTVIAGVARERFDAGARIEDSVRVWIKQGDAYAPSDIAGVWHGYVFSDAAGTQSPQVRKLNLDVGAAGAVTGDGYDGDGATFSLDGTLAVGTAAAPGQVTAGGALGELLTQAHLRMDAGKTVLAGVFNGDDDGVRRPGLIVAVKSAASPPKIVSPLPASTLADTAAVFGWTGNGTPAAGWRLQLGTLVGAGNVFDSGVLPADARDAQLSGLPNDGRALFARLWHLVGGVWTSRDFEYTAYAGAVSVPALTSPVPGGKLAGASAGFAWRSNGTSVTQYRLYVGSTPGALDLHDTGVVAATVTSAVVTTLPVDGRDLYARLYYREAGIWKFVDARYEAAGQRPRLTSHVDDETLASSRVAFSWNGDGASADGWALWFGTTPGGVQYGRVTTDRGDLTAAEFAGLPFAGETVHVTLFWRVAGVFSTVNSRRYRFTAVTAAMPVLTGPESPSDGDAVIDPLLVEAFAGTSATFTWNDGGTPVQDHAVWFGSTPGGLQYGYAWATEVNRAAPASVTSLTFAKLPYKGETVHVTFWWRVNGLWKSRRYLFEAVSLPDPVLTGPESASDGDAVIDPLLVEGFAGTSATFTWNDNGIPVEDHAVWFGSTPGGLQYGYAWATEVNRAAPASVTSLTFAKLPYKGETVHVTFWWRVNGLWKSRRYLFEAVSLPDPVLTGPESASDGDAVIDPLLVEAFAGTSATFTWNDGGTPVQDHAVWFGSTPGGLQYGYAWATEVNRAAPASVMSLTFAKLPYKGETVHVTFWWRVKGVWSSRRYLFKAVSLPDPVLSPGAGTTFTSTSQTFTWNDNGIPTEDHALWFGSTPGGLQYGYVWATEVNGADPAAVDTLTFDRLPVNGATVHVTFWWKVRGVWFSTRLLTTAAGP